MRRSSVSVASEFRTVSNRPVSTVRLCRKRAFMTIQTIGQNPNSAPKRAEEPASPTGIL